MFSASFPTLYKSYASESYSLFQTESNSVSCAKGNQNSNPIIEPLHKKLLGTDDIIRRGGYR